MIGCYKIATKIIFSGVQALAHMSDKLKFKLLAVTYEKLLINQIRV
jgi:hypothetical protein